MRELLLLISCLLLFFFCKDILTILLVMCMLSCILCYVIDDELYNSIVKRVNVMVVQIKSET